ncbi:MAG: PAS domain-containing protein, partial [Myxococcota bacterium]
MDEIKELQVESNKLRERVKELEDQLLQGHERQRGSSVPGDALTRDQLEAILAFEPVVIYALDRDGQIVHVTARSDDPGQPDSLVGSSGLERVHPDSRDEFRHRLDQVLALSESVEFEARAREDDAAARWCRVRLSPWRRAGAMVGAI